MLLHKTIRHQPHRELALINRTFSVDSARLLPAPPLAIVDGQLRPRRIDTLPCSRHLPDIGCPATTTAMESMLTQQSTMRKASRPQWRVQQIRRNPGARIRWVSHAILLWRAGWSWPAMPYSADGSFRHHAPAPLRRLSGDLSVVKRARRPIKVWKMAMSRTVCIPSPRTSRDPDRAATPCPRCSLDIFAGIAYQPRQLLTAPGGPNDDDV